MDKEASESAGQPDRLGKSSALHVTGRSFRTGGVDFMKEEKRQVTLNTVQFIERAKKKKKERKANSVNAASEYIKRQTLILADSKNLLNAVV